MHRDQQCPTNDSEAADRNSNTKHEAAFYDLVKNRAGRLTIQGGLNSRKILSRYFGACLIKRVIIPQEPILLPKGATPSLTQATNPFCTISCRLITLIFGGVSLVDVALSEIKLPLGTRKILIRASGIDAINCDAR